MVGKPHEDGLVNVIAILGDAPHKLVKTVYQRIGNQLLSINQESASIESEMKGLKSKVEPSNDSFNQNKAA
jgi:hypothetical protein